MNSENEQKYHEILISNPRVDDAKMLVSLNIKDWDEFFCFYYPVSSIDNYHLMVHVIWKLSGDDKYVVKAKAKMNIDERDISLLNIRNWDFA